MHVLLKVCAKCVDGQDKTARRRIGGGSAAARRIGAALSVPEDEPHAGS